MDSEVYYRCLDYLDQKPSMNLLYRTSKLINEMAKMGSIIIMISSLFYKMSSYILYITMNLQKHPSNKTK
jgi:hypothetical protein